MELQFEKSALDCLRPAVSQVKNEEHTMEVRLPESMPDIGRVLAAWGQVLLRGKEWRGTGMTVSGGVMAWVLYQPEDGTETQSVECWIPFQTRWDFPQTQRDGVIWASCSLRSIDARSLSARKLMIRAGVSMMGEALEPVWVDVYEPGQIPEDVHLLKNRYPVRLPREAGEKGFALDEELTVPATVGQLGKLIRWQLRPEIAERKIMAGKVVFRGNAHGHVLFRDGEGNLKTWDFSVPFSQFEELEREYGPEADARIIPEVTGMELEITGPQTVHLKAGLVGQYIVSDRTVLELVEDAYSNLRTVSPQLEALDLPAVLDERTVTVTAEAIGDAEGQQILDTAFMPSQPMAHRDDGKMELEIGGNWQLLLQDRDGRLQGQVLTADAQAMLDGDEKSRISAWTAQENGIHGEIMGSRVAVKSELRIDTWSVSGEGIPMVKALAINDEAKDTDDLPSMILRRCGNCRLWDLAKSNRSTVEAIREVNGLDGEPEGDRMLLIPVVV